MSEENILEQQNQSQQNQPADEQSQRKSYVDNSMYAKGGTPQFTSADSNMDVSQLPPTNYNFYTVPEGEINSVEGKEKKSKAKKEKVKKIKKPVTMSKVFASCVACVLVTVLINSGVMYLLLQHTDIAKNSTGTNNGIVLQSTLSTTGSANEIKTNTTANEDGTYSVSQIAQLVMPSVVAITNTSIVEQNYNPFYGGGTYQVQGAGSGIIIGQSDTELLVLTNNHVVEDSVSLSVQFINDISVDKAYVKGTSSKNDLAIVGIKLDDIDTDTLSKIKIATLGSSDDLAVGDGVVAIGNALGYGQSVTVGYVSALERTITIDSNDMTVIQTDAAINGGNSGGALINMKGEVIGINVAKSSSSSMSSTSVEGMGYAIPISDAQSVIENLMNEEPRTQYTDDERGYLGVSAITVDSTTSSTYNLPEGAYVRSVLENSPADEAGIIAGSVITTINDCEVSTADELIEELSYYTEGDTITITASVPSNREYVEKTYTITLTSKSIFD